MSFRRKLLLHYPKLIQRGRKQRIKSINQVEMKGLFCNGDVFREPKKHRFIADTTNEENLSFIAISETMRKSFTDTFLKNICGGRNHVMLCNEPKGRLAGILMGIDLDVCRDHM